jgi:hypothetical protein
VRRPLPRSPIVGLSGCGSNTAREEGLLGSQGLIWARGGISSSREKEAYLIKRIERLESDLAELEKLPPITEGEAHILWELTRTQMYLVMFTSIILIMLAWGVSILSNWRADAVGRFDKFMAGAVLSNATLFVQLRYHRGFRYKRSPKTREQLRKVIDDFKKLRDTWP